MNATKKRRRKRPGEWEHYITGKIVPTHAAYDGKILCNKNVSLAAFYHFSNNDDRITCKRCIAILRK